MDLNSIIAKATGLAGGMSSLFGEGEDPGDPKKKKERIPRPDYKNPESRLSYAQKFTQKYGPLMSGRGDTPLRIDEKPAYGSDTSKNLAVQYAKAHNIDPALFYASSMEEGQSGMYPDKNGKVQWSTNKDYPVSGLWNFGLDSFNYKFKDLVKKGYLPSDFEKKFIYNNRAGADEGAVFKDTDSAIQASAAMLRTHYDDVDDYAKKNNIKLSPKARDFFALASFNGGEGVGRQMIKDYNTNGYLKNDSFFNKRPTSGVGLKETSYKDVYENVIRRTKMADALKEEGYFDDPVNANNPPAKTDKIVPKGTKAETLKDGEFYEDPQTGDLVRVKPKPSPMPNPQQVILNQ